MSDPHEPRPPDDESPDNEGYELAEEPEADRPDSLTPGPPAARRIESPRAAGVTCVQCGYDLSGTPVGGACPECGTAVAETVRRRQEAGSSSPAAVTCLVLGVLAVGCCSFTGPFAIYYYSKAQGEIRDGGYLSGSQTMAVIGLILGIIGTGIMALQAVVMTMSWVT